MGFEKDMGRLNPLQRNGTGGRTMSKLIIEMEMPKRCGACKCRHVEFDIDRVAVFCAIMDNEFVDDPDSIPSWCPIKGELPDEHGDLIDRDALLKHVYTMKAPIGAEVTIVDACYITHAEAVIAAERKDDDD
jgi:hypothetical protein